MRCRPTTILKLLPAQAKAHLSTREFTYGAKADYLQAQYRHLGL